MLQIVADDKIPFLKGVLEPFAAVKYLPGSEISREDVLQADALIVRTRTRCDSRLLGGTQVKFIATATIGHDHIDKDFCKNTGIVWTNAPGCNASSVMQYMASALITIQKERGVKLEGKTLGIIGAGHVGKLVQKLAGILGMNVLLNDPPRERSEGAGEFTGLQQVLTQSDFVTLHVPYTIAGTDKTRHLINAGSISLMKPSAWLINTSRGEVVETRALKAALDRNIIAGTVLDVWENEPEIDRELLGKVFIATPHIAGYSADGKANGTALSVRALSTFFDLPLTAWYPELMPGPLNERELKKDNHESPIAFLERAVLHTYNILTDNYLLRKDPANFEKIRNYYPVRREFNAYSIQPGFLTTTEKVKFGKLGFGL
jgi:erythronate-4-phosphate dehydrogenase